LALYGDDTNNGATQMTRRNDHSALRILDLKADRLHRVMHTPAATPEAVAAYEAAADACWQYRNAHDLLGKKGY
jgi:hypothetical protein